MGVSSLCLFDHSRLQHLFTFDYVISRIPQVNKTHQTTLNDNFGEDLLFTVKLRLVCVLSNDHFIAKAGTLQLRL